MTCGDLFSKLETELYEQIKAVLSEYIDKFKTVSSAIALLDLLVDFAEVAKENKYVRPQIVEGGKPLIIKDGRHPVVETISKDKFIPNDVLLDEAANRTMIITGPNMAGKSTYMRQTGAFGLFCSCKISADSPYRQGVYARGGKRQSYFRPKYFYG